MSTDNDLHAVRVDRCRNGLGVFAARELKVNEVVGELTGTFIDDDNYESDYCIEINSQVSLEPNEPFKFLNHCCQPNCQLVCAEEDSSDLWVETVRDIAPGEELTIDYGWPARSAIVCNCGSPDCRGWIVACDQLEDVALYRGIS